MTRKEILKKANTARKEGDKELAGMLEELNRLKFNFIPQVMSYFKESTFPHQLRIASKFKLKILWIINKIL